MNVGTVITDAILNLSPMRRSFADARKDVDTFASQTESRFDRLKGSAGKVQSAVSQIFSGAAIGAGIKLFETALGLVGRLASGVQDALFGLNNEAEAAQAKINAFTKNAGVTADILAAVRQEASATPFAFREMANATGALLPVAKGANVQWQELLKTAEILAASNPMQGLEGASIALREAMSGDFGSLIARFDLPRQYINDLKEQGVPNIEIVKKAMLSMGYDADLVSAMAETMAGRWSTFMDSIDNVKIAATKPIFDALKDVLMQLQPWLDANADSFARWGNIIGTAIADGINRTIAAIKDLIPVARDVINGDFMGAWEKFLSFAYNNLPLPFTLFAYKVDKVMLDIRQTVHDTLQTIREAWAGDWVDSDEIASPFVRAMGNITTTIRETIGTVRQLFDAMHGNFEGGTGGVLMEDSPIILGLLRVNELADAALGKVSKIQLPSGQTVGGAAQQIAPQLPTGGQVGMALGAAGGAMGIVAMLPMLGHLASGITPLLSLIPALGGVLGALVSPVGLVVAAIAALAVAWTQNWFDIQGKTQAAIDTIKPYLEQFGAFLQGTILPLMQEVWGTIQARIGEAVEAVSPFIDRFVGYLRDDLWPQISQLVTVAGPAFEQMGGAIMRTFEALSPFVEMFIGALVNLGKSVMPILGTMVGYVVDSFGPAISGVIGFLTETIPMLADAFDNVLKIVTPILQSILAIISGVLNAVADFISRHSDIIIRTFKALWDTITGIVSLAWDILTGIIQTGLLLLSGNWSGAWDRIKQMLFDVWEGIKSVLRSAWDVLWGIIDLGLIALKDLWGKAWGWIKDELGRVSDAIVTKLDEWSAGIKTKLDNAANGIKSAILSPFEGARDAIGGIVDAFVTKFKGPLQAGLNAMGKFGSGVAGVMRWIAGALKIDIQIPDPVVPQLAKGTKNWGGGWAWVGEGPGGVGAELAYLPRGARVIPHEESKKVAAELGIPRPTTGAGFPSFAFGLDFPSLADIFGKGKDWLLDKAISALGFAGVDLPGVTGAAGAMFGMVKKWIGTWLAEFVKQALPVSTDQVQKMIQFAQSQVGLPYIWGGGHGGGLGGPGVGFDCSGFVAAVLDAGGIPNPHGFVTSFYEWMAKNGGNGIVDIGVNNPYAAPDVQHIGIRLLGTQYESGGPFGGVGVNGTRFAEWGTPPGWDKARATMNLEHVDVLRSVRNMQKAGVVGQWSDRPFANGGVIGETVAGIGVESGVRYLMGEAGKELVIPVEMMGTLYMYFMVALSTGNLDNPYLMRFPAEMRGVIRSVASRYVNANPGYTSGGPGGPPPVDPSGNPLPRAGSIPPVDPSTYSTGGPPPVDPSGKPLPRGGDKPKTSPFPEEVAPDPNWKGLFVGKSGKVYAPDGEIVRFFTARYWRGVQTGNVWDGYTGIMVSKGDGPPGAPGVGPAAPNTTGLNDPNASPSVPDPTPATKGGSGGGGGVATIRLVINDRTVVLSGIEIVREIVSNDIAISELADGVTEVQAEELGKLGDAPTIPVSPGKRL